MIIGTEEGNWVAGLLPVGAVLVCIPAGMMANLQGRKMALIEIAILQIGASVLSTFANAVIYLYIARFVSGLAMGAYCVLIPMYIPEIAEKSIRGKKFFLMRFLV